MFAFGNRVLRIWSRVVERYKAPPPPISPKEGGIWHIHIWSCAYRLVTESQKPILFSVWQIAKTGSSRLCTMCNLCSLKDIPKLDPNCRKSGSPILACVEKKYLADRKNTSWKFSCYKNSYRIFVAEIPWNLCQKQRFETCIPILSKAITTSLKLKTYKLKFKIQHVRLTKSNNIPQNLAIMSGRFLGKKSFYERQTPGERQQLCWHKTTAWNDKKKKRKFPAFLMTV